MEAQPLGPVGEILALLGRGTRYQGKLCFDGPVRIDGHFEGEAIGDDILVIGPGAEIRGKLDVGTLIVRGGEVWAEVTAATLIEIHAGARVHGELRTPKLFIDRGALFDGTSKMKEAQTFEIDEGRDDSVEALFEDEPAEKLAGDETNPTDELEEASEDAPQGDAERADGEETEAPGEASGQTPADLDA